MNTTKQHINSSNITSTFQAYPLSFQPILKERIWGGSKLKALGKQLPNERIGESWEISMIDTDVNIVSKGIYEGFSLADLINKYPEEILGTKVYKKYGKQFPLLFKFLDAKTDLSIQLHPNDELARKRHNSYGKTETWYIMQADEKARIILGFKNDSSADEYLEHLDNKTLPSVLQEYYVKKGDVFFIETGTIHAIGGGILLAEIQQTSDITYRVYDWDRVDADGNERQLHVDLALDAINYNKKKTKIDYVKEDYTSVPLVNCPYFTTNLVSLTTTYKKQRNNNSFTVYICTQGKATLHANTHNVDINEGETILVPAALNNIEFKGKATLLEVYINKL